MWAWTRLELRKTIRIGEGTSYRILAQGAVFLQCFRAVKITPVHEGAGVNGGLEFPELSISSCQDVSGRNFTSRGGMSPALGLPERGV